MRENKGKSLIGFPDDFCVVDIETTGLDYSCSIIEISALKVVGGKLADHFSSLVKPKVFHTDPDTNNKIYIDDFITSLTGITNAMLDGADILDDVIKKFYDFIGDDILVGHNFASFDSNFLYDAVKKILDVPLSNNFIDTMRMSRWILPDLEHHRLSDVAEKYSINTNGMHRGLKDCEITLQCYLHLKDEAVQNYGSIENFELYIKQKKTKNKKQIKASDIQSDVTEFDESNPIYGSTCVFTGTLEKMTRKEAMQIVKDLGGENGDNVTKKTNYLIIGDLDFCRTIKDGKSSKQKKAEKFKQSGYDIEIISESVFYDMANID